MTRKISAETRRRLKEAAKARWAKDRTGESSVPAEPRPVPQVVAALDVAALQVLAGATATLRGRAYAAGKARIELESISDRSVTVEVESGTDYLVTFELADVGIVSFCECPDDDEWEEV